MPFSTDPLRSSGCASQKSDGHAVDHCTKRWKPGQTTFLSRRQPEGKNVCFTIDTLDQTAAALEPGSRLGQFSM